MLSQGISIAFYNTFFGLTVAVMIILAYMMILGKQNKLMAQMEHGSVGETGLSQGGRPVRHKLFPSFVTDPGERLECEVGRQTKLRQLREPGRRGALPLEVAGVLQLCLSRMNSL